MSLIDQPPLSPALTGQLVHGHQHAYLAARHDSPRGATWRICPIDEPETYLATEAEAHCDTGRHTAPGRGCTCGFALSDSTRHALTPIVEPDGQIRAVIEIEGSGMILGHRGRWRVQRHRIVNIIVPNRCAKCNGNIRDLGVDNHGELLAHCRRCAPKHTKRIGTTELGTRFGVPVTGTGQFERHTPGAYATNNAPAGTPAPRTNSNNSGTKVLGVSFSTLAVIIALVALWKPWDWKPWNSEPTQNPRENTTAAEHVPGDTDEDYLTALHRVLLHTRNTAPTPTAAAETLQEVLELQHDEIESTWHAIIRSGTDGHVTGVSVSYQLASEAASQWNCTEYGTDRKIYTTTEACPADSPNADMALHVASTSGLRPVGPGETTATHTNPAADTPAAADPAEPGAD